MATERADPHSLLSLYRDLIVLRRWEPALVVGSQRTLDLALPLFGYIRSAGDRASAVILNLSATTQTCDLTHPCGSGRIILSTRRGRGAGERTGGRMLLAPGEALVVILDR